MMIYYIWVISHGMTELIYNGCDTMDINKVSPPSPSNPLDNNGIPGCRLTVTKKASEILSPSHPPQRHTHTHTDTTLIFISQSLMQRIPLSSWGVGVRMQSEVDLRGAVDIQWHTKEITEKHICMSIITYCHIL